jgi:hypothetical protein
MQEVSICENLLFSWGQHPDPNCLRTFTFWARRCGLADDSSYVIKSQNCETIRQIPQFTRVASGSHFNRRDRHLMPCMNSHIQIDQIDSELLFIYDIQIYVLSCVYNVYISNCLSCKHASMPQSAAMGFQRPRCVTPILKVLVR